MNKQAFDKRLIEADSRMSLASELLSLAMELKECKKLEYILSASAVLSSDAEKLIFDYLEDPNDEDIEASVLERISKTTGKPMDEVFEMLNSKQNE